MNRAARLRFQQDVDERTPLKRPLPEPAVENIEDRKEALLGVLAAALEEQDAAVADTIARFEATGSPIISDGEQRVSSFATYPIADTLAGSGLAPNLAPGGQYFAIFADGHNRQLPKVTGGPFHYNFYAGDLVKKAVKMTRKPLHQAVIAPSMMYLLYPLDGDLPGYSRKQFEEDIVSECEKDIRSCFAAGAARVVMDFTEGRLAPRNDPRLHRNSEPKTGIGATRRGGQSN
jgi:hypothetical protein